MADSGKLRMLIAQAITSCLNEEVVDEILPKPTIDELERMLNGDGQIIVNGFPLTMLPTGELCRSHKKQVFASDIADAVILAIRSSGYTIEEHSGIEHLSGQVNQEIVNG